MLSLVALSPSIDLLKCLSHSLTDPQQLTYFWFDIAVSVGSTSTATDTALSPKASSLSDTPPAKLVGSGSDAHIPKEPFRRRKVSEIRRKTSTSAGPEATIAPAAVNTAAKPKKKSVSTGSTSTEEITITRVTNPKRVQSAVIEVQTDFDDDVRTLLAPSKATRSAGADLRRDSPAAASRSCAVFRESETQVESAEVGVQHAEVGVQHAEPPPPAVSKKTTVDIGIQAGIPDDLVPPEPRMTSIAIQADKAEDDDDDAMKSVGVGGDSPPPQDVPAAPEAAPAGSCVGSLQGLADVVSASKLKGTPAHKHGTAQDDSLTLLSVKKCLTRNRVFQRVSVHLF